MEKTYVVKRIDREVYKNKLNQNVTTLSQSHQTTYEKANNMLTGIKTAERDLWKVYAIEELDNSRIAEILSDIQSCPLIISEEKAKLIKDSVEDKDKLLEMTSEVCAIFATMEAIKQEALHEQSEADLALSDIYHFIEFTDHLNLGQTYKVMQVLKAVLQKRRKAKNKILIANLYERNSNENIANGKLKQSVQSMFERQYSNRILKDLTDIVTMEKKDFATYLSTIE